jgi:uncharacterized protein (TIGR02453 family)
MPSSTFKGFPAEALKFLRQLERNNNREWFLARKDVYEEKLKTPMAELVSALGGALHGIAPELETDPRRSIYRIYRDIRFSADKTPYKTHMAAIFYPRGYGKNSSAVLYFHFSPEELLIAGGIYMPDAAMLRALRDHIAARHQELRGILGRPGFRQLFGGLEGEKLVRPPKGFPPDHAASDLLRYKQFLVAVREKPELVETARLFPRLLKVFAAMLPLVRFLNGGVRPGDHPHSPGRH